MQFENWGAVDGDGSADGIIANRREAKRYLNFQTLFNAGIFFACAFWYGSTENSAALAMLIVTSTWLVGIGVKREIYQTHTMLMIAERRAQLLEQKIRDIQFSLLDVPKN